MRSRRVASAVPRLALAGYTNAGKSTLVRALAGALRPTTGHIRFDGRDISHLSEPELRPLRRHFQFRVVIADGPYQPALLRLAQSHHRAAVAPCQ